MLALSASLALVTAVTGAMVLMRSGPTGTTGNDVPVVKADDPPASAQPAELASNDKTVSAPVAAATDPAIRPSEAAPEEQPVPVVAAQAPAPSSVAAAQPPASADVVSSSGSGAVDSPALPQLATIQGATALQPADAEPVATIAPIPPVRRAFESARAMRTDAVTNSAGASKFSIKLASRLTERDARAQLSQMQKQFPGMLDGASVTRDDLGKEGVFYRARSGPLSRDAADKLCARLKPAGKSCVPQRS